MLCFFIVLFLCFAGSVLWKKNRDTEIETGTDIKDAEGKVLYETESGSAGKKEYIKWVEFHVTKEALQLACEYDIETHDTEHPIDWVELLAYLAACYGGDFCRFDPADMNEVAEELASGETTIEQLTQKMKYYAYYHEAYEAILGGMIGEYQVQKKNETVEKNDNKST